MQALRQVSTLPHRESNGFVFLLYLQFSTYWGGVATAL